MRYPIYSYALLIDPARVHRHLEGAQRAGVVAAKPNTWQLCLGALRMWNRIIFRSESLGTSSGPPRRQTARARLFENRALRLPALLVAGAVAPWDLTGLFSSPTRLTRHLLAAHHDRNQFVFDFQLLAAHPGRLEALVEKTQVVIDEGTRRERWLKDLVVFEGYHETLLEAAEAAVAGDFRLTEDEARDPDLTLTGLMRWCARSPASPVATWRAWRQGGFSLRPENREPPAIEAHHASA